MTILDEYLEYQDKYEGKYGKNTIVLMEVGMFFELYGVNNNKEILGKVPEISDLLNIQMSRKNKNIIENSRSNPLMAGVPNHSIRKYISILLNLNWTVVMIEQENKGNFIERKVSQIYSPGTSIECNETSDTNNLLSIYIENVEQMNNKKIYVAGISIIDLSTGKNIIYQTNSTQDDKKLCLDEIERFINIHNPREIIIKGKNLDISKEELIRYLEIDNKNYHIDIENEDPDVYKISYQNEFLKRIFTNTGLLTVIEYLDLEKLTYGIISYLFLLRFAYEHNETIINKINKPVIWDNNKYLLLSHSSIYQLNLVSSENIDYNNARFKSLFHVLNKTNTIMGKRNLRETLLNPIIDKQILEKKYNYVESMFEKNDKGDYLYQQLGTYLSTIRDIERLHRKMSLNILPPCEIYTLDMSYQSILQIIDIIKGNELLIELIPDNINEFYNYIEEYKSIYDLNEIVKYNFYNITNSFFNTGVSKTIDEIQYKISKIKEMFRGIIVKLSLLIDEKNDQCIKLEHNEQCGYYLSLTAKRSKKLKDELSKLKEREIEIEGNILLIDDISFDNRNSSVKLNSKLLSIKSNELLKLQEEIKIEVHKLYLEKIEKKYKSYSLILKNIVKFVGEIDLITSNAKISKMYGYCRPEFISLSEIEKSSLIAKDLRHPIIERIDDKLEYVPNDVTIGNDINGMLLYGVNASGKSSLMKSIGLSIIMAQSGMYVPCSKFEYEPYHNLFTRISNNDNIFKGQSTFSVEMSELRSILKRANSKSLILGDELCSGTESISGQSIVAAGIMYLAKKNTSFIFATHMHQLSDIDEIKDLKNVKTYHLKVEYDNEKTKLIYNRKIDEGKGSSVYGLEVCKAMDLEPEFLDTANKIRKNYFNTQSIIDKPKTSHYNSSLYMDICQICKAKAEDVHHIKYQCESDGDGMIGYFHKNIRHNLVPLCKSCHDKNHKGELNINGYIKTTDGIELQYTNTNIVNIKKRKKKMNEEEISKIKGLQDLPNMNKKKAIDILRTNYDLNVSINIISQIWKDIY